MLAIATLLPAPFARASGRYCERSTDLCWRCADIEFPAAIPCSDASMCGPGMLCVDQSGTPTCFDPVTVCCAAAPCETAPGCMAAASSCGDVEGDGRFDHCTFLSPCGEDAGTPTDAGPPADAGPPDDAGTTSDAGSTGDAGPTGDAGEDASVPEDAGAAEDAATPADAGAPSDAGTVRDAGDALRDGGGATSPDATIGPDGGSAPADDGGCGCSVPGTSCHTTPLVLGLLAPVLLCAFRRARRL